MRYDDVSQATPDSTSTTIARADVDSLPPGVMGPASGNVITGNGTIAGQAGADVVADPPGHIIAVQGSGGATTGGNGEFVVQGQYGVLTIGTDGSYTYVRNAGAPDGAQDVFHYTLAGSAGHKSSTTLTVDLGVQTPPEAATAALEGVPGVVNLPAGVEVSDIHVVGRDLVIDLPDGTHMTIPGGAVFVPQFVVGDVAIPSTNLAALLIDSEPKPAAGPPPSSGGNFATDVPPLDPGVPLGDLIPPTELAFQPPEFQPDNTIGNKQPEAGLASTQLDDDDVPGFNGNPGGSGDDSGSPNAIGSGLLPGSGGDGSLTWTLDLTAAPSGFSYVAGPNGSVLVQQVQNGSTVTVLTITVNPSTGAYTVTENHPVMHSAGGSENNAIFPIGYTVTDQDGDQAHGTLTVNVDDDTPVVNVTSGSDSNVVLTTHDVSTVGANSDTDSSSANFSGVFSGSTISYGADGAGPGSSDTYALAVTGSNSGLTSHGSTINLYLVGGVVVGSTAGSAGAISDANTIFTVSVTNTGIVTLTQLQQIDHPISQDPSGTDAPFGDQLISLTDGLVTLTRAVTAVDGDGDSITGSATVNIGANLHFADDGPAIHPTLNEVGPAILDETRPSDSASIALAGGYTAGDDPDLSGGLAIGKGSTTGAVVDANAAFGADGPAAGGGISYDLVVLSTVSGLTTTDGTAIDLVELSNGVVIGVVEGTTTAAFAVSIDSSTGVVSVEQYLSLSHPDSGNPDDVDLLAQGSLGVTVTATDFDGDTASSSPVDISSAIQFHDDGPSVTLNAVAEPSLTVDESNFGGNAGPTSFAGEFNFNFGADGPASSGSIQYNLGINAGSTGLVDTQTGEAVVLSLESGEVVGRAGAGGDIVFTISVDSDGNVSLDQQRAVIHPDATNSNDSITFAADNLITLSATVTDGDGDTASIGTPIAIAQDFHFLDDGPSVAPTINANATVTVDESLPSTAAGIDTGAIVKGDDPDLSGGLAIGQANSGSAIVDPHAVFGADGPAASDSISYALSITSAAASVTLTDGSTITLQLVGGVIVGVVDSGTFAGQAAFALAINATTGVVTVEQYLSLDHPVNPDPNDALGLGNNTIAVTVTATDGDGDAVTSGAVDISHQVTFLDDGPSVAPTINANATVTVDESLPSTAAGIDTGAIVKGDDPDLSGGIAIGQANSGSAIVDPHAVFGADGPAASDSISYSLSVINAASGLTLTDGSAINLQTVNGAIVGVVASGTFAGQAAFAVAINATTGVVTVEQYLSLDHPLTTDANDPLHFGSNIIGVTVTATDGDGDSLTSGAVDIGGQITFLDDGPTANPDTDSTGAVGTTATGNVLTGVDHAGGDANSTDGVADVGGADGRGSITNLVGFGGSTDSNPTGGFDVLGQYGTLHVAANGDYTYTRTGGPGGGTDTFTYTFVDGDGDPASSTLTITLGDSTPNLPNPTLVQLDDDALGGGNPGGTGDDVNSAGLPGQLSATGGDGTLTYGFTGTNTLPTGFTVNPVNATTVQILQGGTIVLTVTLNQTTGAFNVVQNHAIDHPAGADENNLLFQVGVQVTDSDGDSDPATISINVDDDTPTVSANGTVQLDDDALAGGNAGGTGDDPNAVNTTGVLGHSFGADGAGSIAYLTSGAPSGFSYALQGNGDLWVMQGGTHVLTLTVNSTTGAYSVSQVNPIHNAAGGNENNQVFTIGYQVTDHDGDTAAGSLTVNVDDDTPVAVASTTGQAISVDESVGVQSDSNDTTSGTVAALFSGVTNTGSDTDLPQYATNANAIVSSTGSAYGADGAGSTVFSLNVSSAGVDSGLNTTDGHNILLYNEGGIIVGRVSGGTDDGKAAFAVTIDSTGHLSMVEYLSIQHPDSGNPDDSVSVANTAITATVTVTDSDSDSASQSVAIGSLISFQDSAPVMTAADDINIQNDATPTFTGAFAFDLGADDGPTNNDVIKSVVGSATVNGTAVTNWNLTAGSETATSATYTFSFDYPNGTGTTAHETGTLTFDKAGGTYTVSLDSPIAGFSILDTAGAPASAFTNYDLGAATTSNSPTGVAEVQLNSNFWIQFSGVYDKTGADHLGTTQGTSGTFNAVSGAASVGDLDLFTQLNATVTVSSSAAGVAGNTLQGGEVLDFNLYSTNQQGFLGNTPTQSATSMFLQLDGVGGSEDMIVVLKLYDTATHQYSEVALMVQNGDIITNNATLAGTPYSGITLDSNDGLVVVEANDYQNGNTNLVIVGAQIAGSDDGISGTAQDFNGAIGDSGGWQGGTQAFSTDVSDAPFKISNIGFVTPNTTDQAAHLTFDVTIQDGDGDTITQTINADVTSDPNSTSPVTLDSSVATIQSVIQPTSLLATNDNTDAQKAAGQGQGQGNNALLFGAVAAAGLLSEQQVAAADTHTNGSSSHSLDGTTFSSSTVESFQITAATDTQVQSITGETKEAVTDTQAPQSASTHGSEAMQSNSLDGSHDVQGSAAPAALPQGTDAPSHADSPAGQTVAAAAVAMPSAEQIAALAANTGKGVAGDSHAGVDAPQHNEVVAKVIADSLAGGGHDSVISAILDNLPAHGGANVALEALASAGSASVPAWDAASAGAFNAAHAVFSMDAMMLHPDAAPAAHS